MRINGRQHPCTQPCPIGLRWSHLFAWSCIFFSRLCCGHLSLGGRFGVSCVSCQYLRPSCGHAHLCPYSPVSYVRQRRWNFSSEYLPAFHAALRANFPPIESFGQLKICDGIGFFSCCVLLRKPHSKHKLCWDDACESCE